MQSMTFPAMFELNRCRQSTIECLRHGESIPASTYSRLERLCTIGLIEELDMSKIAIDQVIAAQIRSVEGPIELVDSNGQTVGVVRRPPTETEIERAKQRASRGGETMTWAQVRTKIRQEIGE